MKEHKRTTMYRQGRQWVVSAWDAERNVWRESHPLPYWCARLWVGRDNCRRCKPDSQCKRHTGQ